MLSILPQRQKIFKEDYQLDIVVQDILIMSVKRCPFTQNPCTQGKKRGERCPEPRPNCPRL